VTRRKQRHFPVRGDLPRVFDESFVAQLGLPASAKIRFRAGLLNAAGRYVADMAVPSRGRLLGLYSAANRNRHGEASRRLTEMSPATRAFIEKRGARIGLAIPDPQAFMDPARRDDAFERMLTLLRVGMTRDGKPRLHLPPPPVPRAPRREAELRFVMLIEHAYQDAVGKLPSYTASAALPGPFARMVQKCLDRIAGDGVVSAAKMLNELHRRRREMRRLDQLPGSGTAPKG
jgi:hypothetical protein